MPKKKVNNSSLPATKGDLKDVLATMNKGFELMDKRFQATQLQMDQRFEAVLEVLDEHMFALREHSTILDKNTKLLEGINQERIVTEHSVQRLEKDIKVLKQHLHL